MKMKKWNGDKVCNYIFWIGFVLVAFLFAFYINHFIDYMLDSDMSSELILAELLSKEHGLLSANWYYSTELRVLNTQLIFSPLFLVLNDWHMIRVVGTLIGNGILVATYAYLSKKAGLKCFPVFAALLLCPLSEVYFEIVMAGVYYIPHIAITFVSLGMVLSVWKNSFDEKKTWVCLLGLHIISLLAGMGGFRQVMVLYMPLFAAAAVFAYWNYRKGESWKKLLVIAGTTTFWGVAGCLINRLILSKVYVFGGFELQVTGFSFSRLETNINGWLTNFGMQTGNLFSKVNLVHNFAFAVIFCLTVFSVHYILKNQERYKKEQIFLTLFFAAGVITLVVFYLFVEFSGSSNYLLPVSIMFIPVIAAFLEGIDSKWMVRGIQAVLMVVCISVSGLYYHGHTENQCREFMEITDTLLSKNVTEGYASFWNANILTELSDGEIEVWSCDRLENDGLDLLKTYDWLQKKEHSVTVPEGSTFLLLTPNQYMNMEFGKEEYNSYIVYQSDNYALYVFENYDEMMDIYLKN